MSYFVPSTKDVVWVSKHQGEFIDRDSPKEGEKKPIITPLFHLLIYKLNNDPLFKFQGVCLEFGLFANDNSVDGVSERLRFMFISYFEELVKNQKTEQLYEDVSKTDLEKFWAIYRILSLKRASAGKMELENEMFYAFGKVVEKNRELESKLEIYRQREREYVSDITVTNLFQQSFENEELVRTPDLVRK